MVFESNDSISNLSGIETKPQTVVIKRISVYTKAF